MANVYKVLPSTLIYIEDEYTAYCFNEACAYIIGKLESGEEPTFSKKYRSFKDLYKQY